MELAIPYNHQGGLERDFKARFQTPTPTLFEILVFSNLFQSKLLANISICNYITCLGKRKKNEDFQRGENVRLGICLTSALGICPTGGEICLPIIGAPQGVRGVRVWA